MAVLNIDTAWKAFKEYEKLPERLESKLSKETTFIPIEYGQGRPAYAVYENTGKQNRKTKDFIFKKKAVVFESAVNSGAN